MNLQRFIDAKQEELAALRRVMPAPLAAPRPDFEAALRAAPRAGAPLHVIAEFKRSSPSEGVINNTRTPQEAARLYASGGATCMSVLTEQCYFCGSTADLTAAAGVGLPLLRKDFIFHELQVRETFATPASALLLIVALTPDAAQLRDLRLLAESQGIHAVVEVFTEAELDLARESGARILQINARNLETFRTDREACLRMAAHCLPGECCIAASAMSAREHLQQAGAAGFRAALIGTALMRSPAPDEMLHHLLLP